MIDLAIILRRLVEEGVSFVIIGGVAATVHGSSYLTDDLDLCYARDSANLARLSSSLAPFIPRWRGAPADVPFIWDAKTLRHGLNFTLETDRGNVDLLGEVAGLGTYEQVQAGALQIELFGVTCAVLSLDKLIAAKRAAGRPKDLLVLPELEALWEATHQPSE